MVDRRPALTSRFDNLPIERRAALDHQRSAILRAPLFAALVEATARRTPTDTDIHRHRRRFGCRRRWSRLWRCAERRTGRIDTRRNAARKVDLSAVATVRTARANVVERRSRAATLGVAVRLGQATADEIQRQIVVWIGCLTTIAVVISARRIVARRVALCKKKW